MDDREKSDHPIIAVGAVVFRSGDVLLVRRANPPLAGDWSIPGGRVEGGETVNAALRREVKEEAGIEIRIGGFIGIFRKPPYILLDYWAEWVSGEPCAGSDALDAAFRPAAEALQLITWDETRRAIEAAVKLRDTAKERP